MSLQEHLLELVCHTRWIAFRVLYSSPPHYREKYPDLMNEAHATLEEISFPMIQVNDLCDIPPRTLNLLCDGSMYLLGAEQVLNSSSSSSSSSNSTTSTAPLTLHPFLETCAKNGTRSPTMAQLMAIRWFSAVGILNPYELTEIIFGSEENIPEFSCEEEMFTVAAEKLSDCHMFFVGAHNTILRGILQRYCLELVIPEKVIAHYKLACDHFGESDNFSPRAASRLLAMNNSTNNNNNTNTNNNDEEEAAAHELTAFINQTPLDEILRQWLVTISTGLEKKMKMNNTNNNNNNSTTILSSSSPVERNILMNASSNTSFDDDDVNGNDNNNQKENNNNNNIKQNLYELVNDGVVLSRVIQHYRSDVLPSGPIHENNNNQQQQSGTTPNSGRSSNGSSSGAAAGSLLSPSAANGASSSSNEKQRRQQQQGRSPPRSQQSPKLSTWNRQENWSQLIRAMEQIGVWVGIYAEELVAYCTSNLQFHVLRLIEEVFCIVVRPASGKTAAMIEDGHNNGIELNRQHHQEETATVNDNDDDDDEEEDDDDESENDNNEEEITTAVDHQEDQHHLAISGRSTTAPHHHHHQGAATTTTTTSLSALRNKVVAAHNNVNSARSTGSSSSTNNNQHQQQPYFVQQQQQANSDASTRSSLMNLPMSSSPKLNNNNNTKKYDKIVAAAASQQYFTVSSSVDQSMVAELPSSSNFVSKAVDEVSVVGDDVEQPNQSAASPEIAGNNNINNQHHVDANYNSTSNKKHHFSPSFRHRLSSNQRTVNPLAKSISVPIREAFDLVGADHHHQEKKKSSSSSLSPSSVSGRSSNNNNNNNNNVVSMSVTALPTTSKKNHQTENITKKDPSTKLLNPELESILSQLSQQASSSSKTNDLITQLRNGIKQAEFNSVMKHMKEYASIKKNKEQQQNNNNNNKHIDVAVKEIEEEHHHQPQASSSLPAPVAFEIPPPNPKQHQHQGVKTVSIRKLQEKFDSHLNNNNDNKSSRVSDENQQEDTTNTNTNSTINDKRSSSRTTARRSTSATESSTNRRSTSANTNNNNSKSRHATPTSHQNLHQQQQNNINNNNTSTNNNNTASTAVIRKPSPKTSTTTTAKTTASALRQISSNTLGTNNNNNSSSTKEKETTATSAFTPVNNADNNSNSHHHHQTTTKAETARELLAQHQAHVAEIRAHLKEHPNLHVAKRNNRNVITNALRHVCLPGPVNKPLLEIATRLMDEEPQEATQQFVVLLKEEGSAFRGLYAVRNNNSNSNSNEDQQESNNNHNNDNEGQHLHHQQQEIILHRIFGAGPSMIKAEAIGDPMKSGSDRPYRAYKFDTGSKRFSNISANLFSNVVDAVTLWPKLRN